MLNSVFNVTIMNSSVANKVKFIIEYLNKRTTEVQDRPFDALGSFFDSYGLGSLFYSYREYDTTCIVIYTKNT